MREGGINLCMMSNMILLSVFILRLFPEEKEIYGII